MTDLETLATGQPNEEGDIEGAWLSMYRDLRAAGLRWQQAAFVAWSAAPKASRRPRTMRELAEVLGYASEQVFYKWRQQDWFRDYNIETLRQSVFLTYLPDIDRATVAAALTGGHLDRKLFYEQLRESLPEQSEGADVSIDLTFRKALEKAYNDDSDA